MLASAEKVRLIGEDFARGFQDLMRGLWLSGMRVGEAHSLTWDDPTTHHVVELHTTRPKIAFLSSQKNRKDQLVAMTPDFAEFLRKLPRSPDHNFVFHPMGPKGRLQSSGRVAARIRAIGKQAGVVTDPEKGRHATPHDFRRSFGRRWAPRVKSPMILMHLMRHSDIKTTLDYYVGSLADSVAKELRGRRNGRAG